MHLPAGDYILGDPCYFSEDADALVRLIPTPDGDGTLVDKLGNRYWIETHRLALAQDVGQQIDSEAVDGCHRHTFEETTIVRVWFFPQAVMGDFISEVGFITWAP